MTFGGFATFGLRLSSSNEFAQSNDLPFGVDFFTGLDDGDNAAPDNEDSAFWLLKLLLLLLNTSGEPEEGE